MPLAKTTRRTLARTLARPRLFRLLDRAGQRPVTWVWALPGAGKTTMVASYLLYDRATITINGGTFVPEGQSKFIDVVCRNSSGDGEIDGVQLVMLEIGGFF
jgi:hypothetical protein